MAWLYLAEDLERAPEAGSQVVLSGTEAKHVSVARIRAGERVAVGNGRGLLVDAVLVESSRELAVLEVIGARFSPRPVPELTLVQALAKGGRDEMAVQASTELGAMAVIPWQAKRSVSRWDGKAEKGRERWAAIAREASKQSLSAWVPDVAPVQTTAELGGRAAASRMLVLDPLGEVSLRAAIGQEPATEITLVVGPEGGIDDSEFAVLEAAGATRVHLGASVLRTSSAGPAAIAAILALSGGWDAGAPGARDA